MLERPLYLRDSTDVVADPFSDILNLVNAETVVTGSITAGGSWAIRFPAADKIKFFAIVKGSCWACFDDEEEPLSVEAGDVLLLAAKRSFTLSSDLVAVPVEAATLFTATTKTAKLGGREDFVLIGGHVVLDTASGGLLADVLPPFIHVRAESSRATVLRMASRPIGSRAGCGTSRSQTRVGATCPAHLRPDFAGASGNVRALCLRMAARAQ